MRGPIALETSLTVRRVIKANASLSALRKSASEYEKKLLADRKEKLRQLSKARADQDRFRTLSGEELDLVEQILEEGSGLEEIVDDITRDDLRSLAPREWLNDKVMGNYLLLIGKRSKENPGDYPNCHVFATHFYTLLSRTGRGYDFDRVKSWTRRVDLFSMDVIIMPIHMGNHWTMAIVLPQKHHIDYYDSLGGTNSKCVDILKRYMKDEYKDKKKTELKVSWTHTFQRDIPQQNNGYDCGVFACRFAECAGRGSAPDFSQSRMAYFRQRMILEIVSKKIAL